MTLALIDGDILIYKIACGVEQEIRWPDGVWTYSSDEKEAFKAIEQKIQGIMGGTEASGYLICFTDSLNNFRHSILPSYKGNRVKNRKPLALSALRNHCMLNYNCASYPNLEADDVMGILATSPDIEEEVVIVTIDKDLMQIPVVVYNMDTMEASKPEHRDCENIMFRQCITGDTTDGYKGCPGAGEAVADEILSTPFLWESYEHTFQSGKRKGISETRYRKSSEDCTIWESIVSLYEKAGLTEDDALVQARVAHILQHDNYNIDGTINLWSPE